MWTLGPAVSTLATRGERDFCFVVQESKYFCSKAAACFLSNKVARKIAENPKFHRLHIRYIDRRGMFSYVMDALSGIPVDTTSRHVDIDVLLGIAKELENDEAYLDLLGLKWDRTPVTKENVFERIEAKRKQSLWPQVEIDFLAANLDEAFIPIAKEKPTLIVDLGLEFVTALVTNHNMATSQYDELAKLVIGGGSEFKPLIRRLEFEKLSSASMAACTDILTLDEIDDYVWSGLCRRLVLPIGSVDVKAAGPPPKFVDFPSSRGAFAGICAHLREQCGGNPHECGLVEVTSSSDDWNHCWELLNYGWHSYWYTLDEPNAYVQINFKSRRVCVSGYSLMYGQLGNCGFPLMWVLEVSDDGDTWRVIDSQNNRDLDGDYVVATYQCNAAVPTFHQYVRMRQTGKNSRNNDFLLLSEIEIFGKLTTE